MFDVTAARVGDDDDDYDDDVDYNVAVDASAAADVGGNAETVVVTADIVIAAVTAGVCCCFSSRAFQNIQPGVYYQIPVCKSIQYNDILIHILLPW